MFQQNPELESQGRDVQSGASTMNDFRFLRLWWETAESNTDKITAGRKWVSLSKGGAYSRFYIDWELVINWESDGRQIKENVAAYRGSKGWGYHWAPLRMPRGGCQQ